MLKGNYGLTVARYNEMAVEQDNKCAICKKPPSAKSLCVDHDHQTGKVRALLCMRCNTAVGWYEEFCRGFGAKIQEYLK